MRGIDEALSKVITGSEVAVAAPALNAMLDQQAAAVSRRVFQRLNSNETLDPQFAVQAWMELFAIHRTRSGLTRAQTVGQSAGAAISEQMNPGENDG